MGLNVPIFLDVSESDNSISWCLQGQQTWEQFLVFNFDCSTTYRNAVLFSKELFCTFHWSLHSLGAVQRWSSFPFRLSLGYVWTHCKLFVIFNMNITFTWIKPWWYRFALLLICTLSTNLMSKNLINSFLIVCFNDFKQRVQKEICFEKPWSIRKFMKQRSDRQLNVIFVAVHISFQRISFC